MMIHKKKGSLKNDDVKGWLINAKKHSNSRYISK